MDPFTLIPGFFGLICVFVVVVFFIVISTIIFRAAKGVAEWSDNNSKPVLSAPARIVAKRSQMSGPVHSNTGGNVSTYYFATFELPSGDRREFSLGGKEYGMLSEGDEGTLTYQGTRYHGFTRSRR